MEQFTIRRFIPSDQPAIEALERRVGPYLPADAPEVAAMRERAALARESGIGWQPHVPEPDSIAEVDRWYDGFWVATVGHDVSGMVGVRRTFLPDVLPPGHDSSERDSIAELRHLRVAPEARRRGIGSALTRAVIEWCRAERCRTLYLHTTSPQSSARALYEQLGFRDIGHVLTGEYEYVWYSMALGD
jgi:ribosomal protein S18 acetylase RimI-like enzyme